ncbi:MAG: hypothetical protein LBT19_01430 [Candidatus Nomurabacteria bacterium]|jgi:hypothetical protein|nr:hypothetical protein [Candidatus Nomurabacteria bacterium]
MLEINSLIERLRRDFAGLVFEEGEVFMFRPPCEIYYNVNYLGLPCDKIALLTLHEAAHAVLKHKDYDYDIELVRMEAEAWERSKGLCKEYDVEWDEDFVQDRLDSYRDWIHERSLCPVCGVAGWQDEEGFRYRCPMCERVFGAGQ